MDVRDAAQAIGLPRDTALWKLLDVVAKRAAAAERAKTAALREAAGAVVSGWVDDESGMATFDPELIDQLAAALEATE
jgi:hypothetical protein